MKPEGAFLELDKTFWASVRTVSEEAGYTDSAGENVKAPTLDEIGSAFRNLGLDSAALGSQQRPTDLASRLEAYFSHRATALASIREHLQMADQAEETFRSLYSRFPFPCDYTMNKQTGSKKAESYLTCTVKLLLEATLEAIDPLKSISVAAEDDESWLSRQELFGLGTQKFVQSQIIQGKLRRRRIGRQYRYHPGDVQKMRLHCDYDPRTLTTVTRDGLPFRTLSRRVDGAYPGPVNPIAIWEIKEYYYTTTFGSRIADGIFETLLDGAELEELHQHYHLPIHHYLFVDAYETWWEMGKPYLCRLVDALHMGYVDEVIFGREALTRVPELAKEWSAERKRRDPELARADLSASQVNAP